MAGDGVYWSVQECAWVACPGKPDALATPWSSHGLTGLAGVPHPKDADDLLRTRRRDAMPAQRPSAEREQAPDRV